MTSLSTKTFHTSNLRREKVTIDNREVILREDIKKETGAIEVITINMEKTEDVHETIREHVNSISFYTCDITHDHHQIDYANRRRHDYSVHNVGYAVQTDTLYISTQTVVLDIGHSVS